MPHARKLPLYALRGLVNTPINDARPLKTIDVVLGINALYQTGVHGYHEISMSNQLTHCTQKTTCLQSNRSTGQGQTLHA